MACAAIDPILLMASTKTYATVTDYLTPPYSYVPHSVRKPPDGYITGLFILEMTILIFPGHILMEIGKIIILYYVINVHGTEPSESSTCYVKSDGPEEDISQNHAFVSEQENKDSTFSFVPDLRTAILDNSTNMHICNDTEYHVDGIHPVPTSHSCATVGGGL